MLDIHIADSFDSASRSEPVARIGFDVHASLFGHGPSSNDCPLIGRLAEFHSDCIFTPAELPRLVLEIDTIAATCNHASEEKHTLMQLRDACELAITRGQSIYALCD